MGRLLHNCGAATEEAFSCIPMNFIDDLLIPKPENMGEDSTSF